MLSQLRFSVPSILPRRLSSSKAVSHLFPINLQSHPRAPRSERYALERVFPGLGEEPREHASPHAAVIGMARLAGNRLRTASLQTSMTERASARKGSDSYSRHGPHGKAVARPRLRPLAYQGRSRSATNCYQRPLGYHMQYDERGTRTRHPGIDRWFQRAG